MIDTLNVIEAAAAHIGVQPATIAKWKTRGRVPYRLRMRIAEIATERGQPLTDADFDRFGWRRERSA
jgi:hypothetical protein